MPLNMARGNAVNSQSTEQPMALLKVNSNLHKKTSNFLMSTFLFAFIE